MRIVVCVFLALAVLPRVVSAQDNGFRLAVPDALASTGFLDYLLPRFSLKTAVRITRVAEGETAELVLNADGRGAPVFQGPKSLWYLEKSADTAVTSKFLDWLASDVGNRTIVGFQPDGAPVFSLPPVEDTIKVVRVRTGDPIKGEDLSLRNCGRCHVVNETNRMKAIGSTPSFGLIRTLDGWETRFETFYILKPHPSFTQIEGVTQPFDPARPPAIVPLQMTLKELEDILAFVAKIQPADLGAPLQTQ